MEDDYALIFHSLLLLNFLAVLPALYGRVSKRRRRSESPSGGTGAEGDAGLSLAHRGLLRTYLPAYLLATCADWLQGPYKYALYSAYGYTRRDIARLFVAGYGSGMVLGSVAGGLADSYGRKRLCLLYCASCALSVLMKHCDDFRVLLFGRVCGGVATSLLFSVFESWLVGAHAKRGLVGKGGERWLARSLAASAYGSSLAAVGSGVLAEAVVRRAGGMRPWGRAGGSLHVGGYVAAFDACLVPLALCAALIASLWEENYGEGAVGAPGPARGASLDGRGGGRGSRVPDDEESAADDGGRGTAPKGEANVRPPGEGLFSALVDGARTTWNSPEILTCCVVGSVFEGAMYVFVFLWTPALSSLQDGIDSRGGGAGSDELPFGRIFSTFMACCALGTAAFSRLSGAGVPASRCLAGVLALASLSCVAMARPGGGDAGTSATTPQYVGMLVYEFCIGF